MMTARNHHPLVSYQPLRLLFQLSYAALTVLRLPYYATISLIPALRPIRAWTAKQTFMTRILYPFLDATSRVGITETLTLEPGSEGERFQTVPTPSSDLFKGPLASETVRPEKVGGTWFPNAPGTDLTSKNVVLFLHGGAYIQGDGRTAQYGSIAKKFLDTGAADAVFSLQYRLSGHGNANPFPAALQDALSSYVFLLNTLKIPPSQIIFAGDSAGAHLAISLLRYLHEYGSAVKVPTPKCAVLISPWVEPFYYNSKNNLHRKTDFVPGTFGGIYHPSLLLEPCPVRSCAEVIFFSGFYFTSNTKQLGAPIRTRGNCQTRQIIHTSLCLVILSALPFPCLSVEAR